MEAEKIIIYLTPFILEINLDIIIFEDNEEQIINRLSYEDKNSEKSTKDNVITLLNRNAHYEIIYTSEEYNKFSTIYNLYEILEKNKNLEDIGFFLLESNRNKNIDRNTNYSLNSKLKNIDNNTKSNINTINKNINNSYSINEEMKKIIIKKLIIFKIKIIMKAAKIIILKIKKKMQNQIWKVSL